MFWCDIGTKHLDLRLHVNMVKRKANGFAAHGRSRGKQPKPSAIRPVPGPSILLEPEQNQGQTLFLESYKDIDGHHSSYNVIPGQHDNQLRHWQGHRNTMSQNQSKTTVRKAFKPITQPQPKVISNMKKRSHQAYHDCVSLAISDRKTGSYKCCPSSLKKSLCRKIQL